MTFMFNSKIRSKTVRTEPNKELVNMKKKRKPMRPNWFLLVVITWIISVNISRLEGKKPWSTSWSHTNCTLYWNLKNKSPRPNATKKRKRIKESNSSKARPEAKRNPSIFINLLIDFGISFLTFNNTKEEFFLISNTPLLLKHWSSIDIFEFKSDDYRWIWFFLPTSDRLIGFATISWKNGLRIK